MSNKTENLKKGKVCDFIYTNEIYLVKNITFFMIKKINEKITNKLFEWSNHITKSVIFYGKSQLLKLRE
jgi:hypothetical protein